MKAKTFPKRIPSIFLHSIAYMFVNKLSDNFTAERSVSEVDNAVHISMVVSRPNPIVSHKGTNNKWFLLFNCQCMSVDYIIEIEMPTHNSYFTRTQCTPVCVSFVLVNWYSCSYD